MQKLPKHGIVGKRVIRMRLKAMKAAFPHTIPVLTGYLFLGFSYGVYMNVSGFGFVYPMVMSAVIYGGSLEFLTVSMLLSPFAPLQVFAVSLMIQARHLFYGISMLEKFKGTGRNARRALRLAYNL